MLREAALEVHLSAKPCHTQAEMREIAVTVTIGCLAKTPFWDLSVVQVCKKASVASASFYNAFAGGKPELIRTVYERVEGTSAWRKDRRKVRAYAMFKAAEKAGHAHKSAAHA